MLARSLRRSLLLGAVVASPVIGCSAGVSVPSGGTEGSSATTSGTSTASGTGGGATATTASGITSAGGSGGATATSTVSATTGAGGSGGGSGSGGSGGMDLDGGAGDGGPPINAEVYAHSAGTLYRLDPITKKVTTVGNFSGCDTVIDIALDKSGNMVGTTFGGVFKINKSNAACTLIALGGYPNSLSFVPAGTVDPVNEALVGYNGSTYVRIDTSTGVVTNIGSLGNQGYSSSGDMVSIIGGGSYLTVNGNGCSDCIVEVNPTTGALMNVIGALGHSSVFGLAYWGGVAYGFDDFGALFEIDVTTGMTTVIPIPNAPPGLSFYGAGSTTAAPLHM